MSEGLTHKMATRKEITEVFERLRLYVGCQRTDLMPIFMSRLNTLIKELECVIKYKKTWKQ